MPPRAARPLDHGHASRTSLVTPETDPDVVFAHYRAAFRAPVASAAFCAASFVAAHADRDLPARPDPAVLASRAATAVAASFGTRRHCSRAATSSPAAVGNPLVSRLVDRFGADAGCWRRRPSSMRSPGSRSSSLYETHAPDERAGPYRSRSLGLSYLPIGVTRAFAVVLRAGRAARTGHGLLGRIDPGRAHLHDRADPGRHAGHAWSIRWPAPSSASRSSSRGSLWLRTQPGTDPPLTAHPDEARRSALTYPGMVTAERGHDRSMGADVRARSEVAVAASRRSARRALADRARRPRPRSPSRQRGWPGCCTGCGSGAAPRSQTVPAAVGRRRRCCWPLMAAGRQLLAVGGRAGAVVGLRRRAAA